MCVLKLCFVVILLVLLEANLYECKFKGGGGRRPSPAPRPRPAPSPHRPFPSQPRYTPAPRRPFPSPAPRPTSPPHSPFPSPPPKPRPSAPVTPRPPQPNWNPPKSNVPPVASAPPAGPVGPGINNPSKVNSPPVGTGNVRPPPYGFATPRPTAPHQNFPPQSNYPNNQAKPPPIGFVTPRPFGPQQNVPPKTNVHPNMNYPNAAKPPPIGFVTPRPMGPAANGPPKMTVPPRMNVPPNQGVQGPVKPYPTQGYHPAGQYPGYPSYPSYPSYHPSANYPRYPSPGGHYYPPNQGAYYPSYQGPQKIKIVNKYNYSPGYSFPMTYPSYHYSRYDTGSGALGFFLGYSLARVTTPTFYHSHYSYDGYRPVYDHYTVHHYHHNRERVEQRQVIQSNAIMECGGDSPNICPSNTVALCKTDGTIMCVVNMQYTTACPENSQLQCARSRIPCEKNDAPECKNTQNKEVEVTIPCVSNAEVQANVTTVNNTVVVQSNVTIPETFATNTTSGIPVTTLPPARISRSVPTNNFCVTIIAVPAARTLTEGEVALEDFKGIFGKVVNKVINR